MKVERKRKILFLARTSPGQPLLPAPNTRDLEIKNNNDNLDAKNQLSKILAGAAVLWDLVAGRYGEASDWAMFLGKLSDWLKYIVNRMLEAWPNSLFTSRQKQQQNNNKNARL